MTEYTRIGPVAVALVTVGGFAVVVAQEDGDEPLVGFAAGWPCGVAVYHRVQTEAVLWLAVEGRLAMYFGGR